MQVARTNAGGEALMALNIDSPVSTEIVAKVAQESGAEFVRAVTLIS
jgi:D-3-phosphoglycerate dehydrogenase